MARSAQAACTVCEIHAESVFKIEGMDCHEEVAVLERRLKHLTGLEDMHADVMGQRLRVRYDAARLSASAITDAVAQTGMRAWLEHEEPIASSAGGARMRQWLVGVSGGCLLAGYLLGWMVADQRVALIFYLAAVALGAIHTGRRAIAAIRSRALDINALMIVAVLGALAIGEHAEAATVMFLFGVAQLLETYSLDRARGAIRALMDLTPLEAIVRRGGAETRVSVDALSAGDAIVIRPGEKVPLDGRVSAGTSYVNQAPITGESLPVEKRAGDEVFAGSINGRGALEVTVTRLRRDTTLAHVIHLVERAQGQRAPAQAFIDRFARIYTPAVLALAAAVAVLPPLVTGADASVWFYRALVMLVIACPCALVISTPVSIVSALAGAARKGVLIKGGIHLERAGTIKCIAFDKTGTLTRGVLSVVDVVALDGIGRAGVLRLAASLEARSEHPIARAILAKADEEEVSYRAGDGFQSLPGRGARAMVGGRDVLIGNHRLFEDARLCTPRIHEELDALAAAGHTAVLVAEQDRPVGIIAVADQPREAAADAVALLHSYGVQHIVMLTGDNEAAAAPVARALGVDQYRAELLPEEKVAAIEDLRRLYGPVAMVGDGVNDAPALAAADVGIAMGVAGTDAALETADIALMADELLKVPYAIRLSRATLRNIHANIAFSLVMKLAFLIMAMSGAATLWMAVLADTGASLIVIANALRLLRAD